MKRFVALALALSACGPSPERVEAQRVRAAIARLRSSDKDNVVGLRDGVTELELWTPKLPEAQRAATACAHAYRLLLEAKEIVQIERPRIGRPGPEHLAEFEANMAGLKEAEAKLDASEAAMPACDAASTDLTLALSH